TEISQSRFPSAVDMGEVPPAPESAVAGRLAPGAAGCLPAYLPHSSCSCGRAWFYCFIECDIRQAFESRSLAIADVKWGRTGSRPSRSATLTASSHQPALLL